jgi:hypothetical protein
VEGIMLIKRLLQLNIIVSGLIAVCFILAPEASLSLYGITGDPALQAVAQYFGTAHVAFAILLWLALRLNDSRFLRAIVVSFFAGDLAGSAVLLLAQLSGTMNSMGWALVGLSIVFAIGYGYGALRKLPE